MRFVLGESTNTSFPEIYGIILKFTITWFLYTDEKIPNTKELAKWRKFNRVFAHLKDDRLFKFHARSISAVLVAPPWTYKWGLF